MKDYNLYKNLNVSDHLKRCFRFDHINENELCDDCKELSWSLDAYPHMCYLTIDALRYVCNIGYEEEYFINKVNELEKQVNGKNMKNISYKNGLLSYGFMGKYKNEDAYYYCKLVKYDYGTYYDVCYYCNIISLNKNKLGGE